MCGNLKKKQLPPFKTFKTFFNGISNIKNDMPSIRKQDNGHKKDRILNLVWGFQGAYLNIYNEKMGD